MDDVEDFLKGPEAEVTEPETETVEPVAENVEPETSAPVRDEKGRFAPKGETQAEPVTAAPPAAEETTNPVPVKALQEERRKRQELEAKLAAIEERLAAAQPEPAPVPSVFEDEDGFATTLEQRAVQAALARIAPQLEQQQRAVIIEMKRQLYRDNKPDFAELETELFEEMQGNPALAQQVMTAEDPVEFGYRYMKNKKEVAQYGSLDLEAIKAAAKAEALAELQAANTPAPAIPTSLADAQSARTSAVTATPPTLDSILGR